MRIFFVHHITWSINSICHFFGSRRFDDRGPLDQRLAGSSLASLGEAWHHNHHAFPRSAVHGLRRWELDPSGVIIGAMQKVGLAWNVVRITPGAPAAAAGVGSALGARRSSSGARTSNTPPARSHSHPNIRNNAAPAERRTPNIESPVQTWILTGDLTNFRINVERGFD